MIALVPAADAQLPTVQVPNLPRVELPNGASRTVDGVLGPVANDLDRLASLADVRRLRIQELLRTQRQLVERDPNGAPVVRAEIVALSPTDAVLESARQAGFTIAREQVLETLDMRVFVLRAPERMSTRRALARLRELDLQGTYDYNHIYLDSGSVDSGFLDKGTAVRAPRPAPAADAMTGAATGTVTRAPRPATAAAAANPAVTGAATLAQNDASGMTSPGIAPEGHRARIGLIDGGVDAQHPVFRGGTIQQHGCAGKPVPSSHGTAVASLLVGRSELFHGALPDAELFAADVYCGAGTGGAVDAVVEAFGWLAREHVPVMNVSLVGPANTMLEGIVKALLARGFIIVAAVGNDGPAAPPLYPASYAGVIGVTGVDAHHKVLLEACRGPQVDFAAPGADMAAAMTSLSYAAVRGTSFAAPLVAGLLAAQLREPNAGDATHAVEMLTRQAIDLGARGPDRIYGNGLVGDELRSAPVAALIGAPSRAATK